MNKEHAELVGRLREWVREVADSKLSIIADCQEAATAIERLSKDNERLANSIIGLIDGIAFLEEAGVAVGSTALKDELAAARTALQLHKGE